jgi:hypothetical protein
MIHEIIKSLPFHRARHCWSRDTREKKTEWSHSKTFNLIAKKSILTSADFSDTCKGFLECDQRLHEMTRETEVREFEIVITFAITTRSLRNLQQIKEETNLSIMMSYVRGREIRHTYIAMNTNFSTLYTFRRIETWWLFTVSTLNWLFADHFHIFRLFIGVGISVQSR